VSHIVDTSMSGAKPRGHHLPGVLLHALSTALLFLVLARVTADVGRSAAAAALFGVHPLRLESVAWVAERKDVLSGFLFMVVLWLYARYAADPRPRRMGAVAGALALGLMAKPMLVTAPFVLLLLDVWPLARAKTESWKRLVIEKAPLFALAILSCALTVWAQSAHAVRSLQEFPFGVRAPRTRSSPTPPTWERRSGPRSSPSSIRTPARASRSGRWPCPWPSSPRSPPSAVVFRRTKPWLPVGWLWYAGMLVPVIGLVQVGQAAWPTATPTSPRSGSRS
jgi:hypothetical protein